MLAMLCLVIARLNIQDINFTQCFIIMILILCFKFS